MRQGWDKRRSRGPRLIDRLSLHWSKGVCIDGLWVGAETVDDKSEPILRRLEEALCLIKTHDPLRYRRITRDLKRVWALWIPHPTTCFDHRLHACMLNTRFVLAEASTPESIAQMIVHEATHARLWGCGIGYQEEHRARVEAVCVRRELAFAAKLPNGQRAREWAEHSLVSHCDPANLTNAALDKQRVDQTIEELRRLGVPNWVLRIILAVRPAVRGVIRFAHAARRG